MKVLAVEYGVLWDLIIFFFSKKICVYDKILVLLCVSFAKLCSWRTTQKVLSCM